jgi:hypothetical protein
MGFGSSMISFITPADQEDFFLEYGFFRFPCFGAPCCGSKRGTLFEAPLWLSLLVPLASHWVVVTRTLEFDLPFTLGNNLPMASPTVSGLLYISGICPSLRGVNLFM